MSQANVCRGLPFFACAIVSFAAPVGLTYTRSSQVTLPASQLTSSTLLLPFTSAPAWRSTFSTFLVITVSKAASLDLGNSRQKPPPLADTKKKTDAMGLARTVSWFAGSFSVLNLFIQAGKVLQYTDIAVTVA